MKSVQHWWMSGSWSPSCSHVCLLGLCHSASVQDQILKSTESVVYGCVHLLIFCWSSLATWSLVEMWSPLGTCLLLHYSVVSAASPCPQLFKCPSAISLCVPVSCFSQLILLLSFYLSSSHTTILHSFLQTSFKEVKVTLVILSGGGAADTSRQPSLNIGQLLTCWDDI